MESYEIANLRQTVEFCETYVKFYDNMLTDPNDKFHETYKYDKKQWELKRDGAEERLNEAIKNAS